MADYLEFEELARLGRKIRNASPENP